MTLIQQLSQTKKLIEIIIRNKMIKHEKFVSISDIRGKFTSPFISHLFMNEPRIKFYSFGNHDTDTFFWLDKSSIYFAHDFPAIEHEIAHMVEMRNQARWILPDWGMSMNVCRKEVKPATFFAALSREIRVRAIQLHLNSEELTNRHSTLVNIFNNYLWEGKAKSCMPFGRFKNFDEVQLWANDLKDKTYNAWSLDRIEAEWKVRLTHIQNYMETIN